jgi:uncharacterized protein
MPTTSPTTEYGRTIASMYEAFGRGDVEFVMSRLDARVDWIETEAEEIPIRGRFPNPEEVLHGVFAKVPQHFESFELRPELWVESGDDVVVTGRVVAKTRAGRGLNAPYAHVFSFRDGKVSRNENHHDTALWSEALS